MEQSTKNAVFWHRRDLRFDDNAGLYKALRTANNVYPVFIFDSNILTHLPKNDKRVSFIHASLFELKKKYQTMGSDLIVRIGDPKVLIPKLAQKLNAEAVFTNRDYEPQAIDRDAAVYQELTEQKRAFYGAKDQVIFEKKEVVKDNNEPYTVFTPYSKKWKEKLNDFYLKEYPNQKYAANLAQFNDSENFPSLHTIGFEEIEESHFPEKSIDRTVIEKYKEQRDFPATRGTTRLSVHLRFGTISIRQLASIAHTSNEAFLNELIWRDFYQMILYHFPKSVNQAIKPKYDAIPWIYNEHLFQAWCHGKTGYPLVDAGMRELNTTGFMHNRVRMVVASFLTKHLLHDWRLGERYFAEKLLDFDLASNVGGWQWAAGSGCDAAPYFRIFNPTSQQERFDPNFDYIRKWVPEYGTKSYPKPIVEHKVARQQTLDVYKAALSE
jgi:deoxyribodipyrimidine photo-lyase